MNVYMDELPYNCDCCPCNDDYYRCGLSGDLFDEHDIDIGRMKNCKLKRLADVRENIMGKWIEDNHREKSMMWRCSVCGRIAYYPTIGERKSYKKHCGYNFCPNCGADMRREDNGRDEENHNRV